MACLAWLRRTSPTSSRNPRNLSESALDDFPGPAPPEGSGSRWRSWARRPSRPAPVQGDDILGLDPGRFPRPAEECQDQEITVPLVRFGPGNHLTHLQIRELQAPKL